MHVTPHIKYIVSRKACFSKFGMPSFLLQVFGEAADIAEGAAWRKHCHQHAEAAE